MHPQIQNISGASLKSALWNLDFSLGELASIGEYTSNNKVVLSTGFFQSFIPIVTSINEQNLEISEFIKASPNPVENILVISASYNYSGKFQYKIIDINSNIIASFPSITNQDKFNKQVDLSHIPSGTYFLHCLFESNYGQRKNTILKIIKL